MLFAVSATSPVSPVSGAPPLAPMRTFTLHDTVFTVAEVGEARYTAAAGELPFSIDPGAAHRYADAAGPRGACATVDLDDPTSVYVGRVVTLAELGIAGAPEVAREPATVPVRRLACPACGGSLELRTPEASE